MVEPIGHTGGVIDPPDEYLPILREICDRHNILLIFDEIITGIGRTGRMFAAETFGVTPDVLCVAKGMSGGYAPLSAMICRRADRRRLLGADRREPRLRRGAHLRGQPDLLRRRDRRAPRDPRARPLRQRPRPGRAAPRRLRGPGAEVRRHRRHPRQGAVPGHRVRPRPGDQGALPDDWPSACRSAAGPWRNGLLCRFDPHWIAFGPPLVVTAEQIDEMVAVLDRSMGEVLGNLA